MSHPEEKTRMCVVYFDNCSHSWLDFFFFISKPQSPNLMSLVSIQMYRKFEPNFEKMCKRKSANSKIDYHLPALVGSI